MITTPFTKQMEMCMIELYNNNAHPPDNYLRAWIEDKFNCKLDPFWMVIHFENQKDYNWFIMHV